MKKAGEILLRFLFLKGGKALYATYTFYQDTYNGALSEEEFLRLAPKAVYALDALTLDRAKNHADTQPVQLAFCACVDALKELEEAPAGVKSEKNDVLSITYSDASMQAKGREQRLCEAVKPYLRATGLLFRGIRGKKHAWFY